MGAARTLLADGVSARVVAERMGLPLATVQHWSRGDRRVRRPPCPVCGDQPLDEVEYAYLLGTYLGDGRITVGRRGVAALSIYCADDRPGIRAEAAEALRAVLPTSSVCAVARNGCHQVKSYSTHWTCLFPQHGPGRKHTRTIELQPWQQAVVERHPGRLLRGLFHSDGCRVINWATKTTATGKRRYEYPRYFFSDKSPDILCVCEGALDLLDVPHTRPRWDMISVARRAAVATLDEHIGPKY